jgi:hypothetical protein
MKPFPEDCGQVLPDINKPMLVFYALKMYFTDEEGGYCADLGLEQSRDAEVHRVVFASHQAPQLVEAILRALAQCDTHLYSDTLRELRMMILRRQNMERSRG